MKVSEVSAIIVVSNNPEYLKSYYEKILDLKFVKDSHDELGTHYYAKLGELRLIIHPADNYPNMMPQSGAMTFYFSVDSIDELVERLESMGTKVLKRVKETFGERIEFKDPDGNLVCATQLNVRMVTNHE